MRLATTTTDSGSRAVTVPCDEVPDLTAVDELVTAVMSLLRGGNPRRVRPAVAACPQSTTARGETGRSLRPGDTVLVAVNGLGHIENPVVSEPVPATT